MKHQSSLTCYTSVWWVVYSKRVKETGRIYPWLVYLFRIYIRMSSFGKREGCLVPHNNVTSFISCTPWHDVRLLKVGRTWSMVGYTLSRFIKKCMNEVWQPRCESLFWWRKIVQFSSWPPKWVELFKFLRMSLFRMTSYIVSSKYAVHYLLV
jgi:hypothetical protein